MRARMLGVTVSGMLLLLPSTAPAQLGVGVDLGVGYVFEGVDVDLWYAAGPVYDAAHVAPTFGTYALSYRRHPRHGHVRHLPPFCWDDPWHFGPWWDNHCYRPIRSFGFALTFGFGFHSRPYYAHYRPHHYDFFRPYRVAYAYPAFWPGYVAWSYPVHRPYYRPVRSVWTAGYPRWGVGYATARGGTVGPDGYRAPTVYKESPRRAVRRTAAVAGSGSRLGAPSAVAPDTRSPARRTAVRSERPSDAGSARARPRTPASARAPERGARTVDRPTDRLRGRAVAEGPRSPSRRPSAVRGGPDRREGSARAGSSREGPSARAPSGQRRPSARVPSRDRTPSARAPSTQRRPSARAPSRQRSPAARAPSGAREPSARAPSRGRRPSVRAPSRPRQPSARAPSRAPRPSARSRPPRSVERSRPTPPSAGSRRPSPRVRSAPGVRDRSGGVRAPSGRPRARPGGRRGGGPR